MLLKYTQKKCQNNVPELRAGPVMCGTVDMELVWWEDTVAGEADPLGLVSLLWSAGFWKKHYRHLITEEKIASTQEVWK